MTAALLSALVVAGERSQPVAAAPLEAPIAATQPERGSSAVGASARKRAPVVDQLVVFRDGGTLVKRVTARQAKVRVGGRTCAVAAGTALAALARSKPGPLRLFDYGSCSQQPRDGAGLFVRGIRGDGNRGQDGWVYKLGNRAASAGAADPTGPFGRGRLRSQARVTWFYCDQGDDGCQRTLGVRASTAPGGGGVLVRVTGYDDRGEGVSVEGATVHVGSASATTGADGSVTVPLALPGSVRVHAEKAGLVRSFSERVTLR